MTNRTQKTISPIDGALYAERAFASGSEVENALQRAREAQKHWRPVPIAERAAACRAMADWCV
ncbi:MAG: aldehyde dehydrogenase, partial [Betaproteobacteria bacterium]|nr:aldehyde dehydrogenase [Betaproteobacteria bacterium]